MSTNQKVIKEQENSQGRYQKEMPQTLFRPSVNRNRGKADNVYFANRLRKPVLDTKLYFGAKKGTVEGFILHFVKLREQLPSVGETWTGTGAPSPQKGEGDTGSVSVGLFNLRERGEAPLECLEAVRMGGVKTLVVTPQVLD